MAAHGEFAQTAKQTEIMRQIIWAVDRGVLLTLEGLREKLSYKPSKQAILCSLRILEDRGFIMKLYHGNASMELQPTAKAYATFRPQPLIRF